MTWIEYKEAIADELSTSPSYKINRDDGSAKMLFRGQANSSWQLKTTLERYGNPDRYLNHYMEDCTSARRFIGNIFRTNIPYEEKHDWEYDYVSRFGIPNYEYLGYLRHHGFPSPLLDWSESPYVAAFFAFRNIPEGVEQVSIYGYREHTADMGRCYSPSEPTFFVIGPFESIHERHIAQQCCYTICLKNDKSGPRFCPHEEGYSEENTEQDIVVKWDIDLCEREKVLGELFQMNITPVSLFRSEDSAAETAALRIIK